MRLVPCDLLDNYAASLVALRLASWLIPAAHHKHWAPTAAQLVRNLLVVSPLIVLCAPPPHPHTHTPAGRMPSGPCACSTATATTTSSCAWTGLRHAPSAPRVAVPCSRSVPATSTGGCQLPPPRLHAQRNEWRDRRGGSVWSQLVSWLVVHAAIAGSVYSRDVSRVVVERQWLLQVRQRYECKCTYAKFQFGPSAVLHPLLS